MTEKREGDIAGSRAPRAAAQADGARPVKHSFSIRGHRTSISLESAFWEALGEMAAAAGRSRTSLVAEIDAARGASGLSGAIRVAVLDHFRRRSGGAGERS